MNSRHLKVLLILSRLIGITSFLKVPQTSGSNIYYERSKTMQNKMLTLFLICGLPGAGKTTLAKTLEETQHALRLTPDEWMAKIVGDGFDEEKRSAVEAIMWEIGQRCLSLGVNVILDFGFWSRTERDDYRARAKKIGAHTELFYLNVPLEEILRRLHARNETAPENTFHVTEAQLRLWSSMFEVPADDEITST